MTLIRPFRGYRPRPEIVTHVASPPYDVLSSNEARDEAKGNAFSFLHVTKPEIDFPSDIEPHHPSVYEKGRENLASFIQSKILIQDEQPCFYIYSQSTESHTQSGIVGGISCDDYNQNTIRKHERTRQDKEEDRTRHIEITNAHTGLVFLAYRAEPKIDELIYRQRSAEPVYDFSNRDGVRHQFWIVKNPQRIRAFAKCFANVDSFYIADGHHRAAAAARVAYKRSEANVRHTGMEEYNYFPAAAFPHNQLRILDYNRLVRGLNGLNAREFLRALEKEFVVSRSRDQVRPQSPGEFGMYLNGSWYNVTLHPTRNRPSDLLERLDATLLERLILEPLLGIRDTRSSDRIDFVGGKRGTEELERRVNSGEMTVAFTIHPPSIEQMFEIADSGRMMPPKSTWFEPKLLDGLVVHLLE